MLSRPFAIAHRGACLARVSLVWLALVMALAQLVAVRHAYSHAPGEASTQFGSKQSGNLAHCDACVAVAALGAGAPPATALFIAALDQRLPQPVASAVQPAPQQQQPYAIRAPPAIAS